MGKTSGGVVPRYFRKIDRTTDFATLITPSLAELEKTLQDSDTDGTDYASSDTAAVASTLPADNIIHEWKQKLKQARKKTLIEKTRKNLN